MALRHGRVPSAEQVAHHGLDNLLVLTVLRRRLLHRPAHECLSLEASAIRPAVVGAGPGEEAPESLPRPAPCPDDRTGKARGCGQGSPHECGLVHDAVVVRLAEEPIDRGCVLVLVGSLVRGHRALGAAPLAPGRGRKPEEASHEAEVHNGGLQAPPVGPREQNEEEVL